MPIVPLPVFEAEADPKVRGLSEAEIAEYEGIKPPDTVVVRYGYMRQIGEFPARLDFAPGCGTKFVIKTPRGLEVGEMLTTTCPNSGCGKSISRLEMLEYIENSGGRQYPFTTEGRIVRLATPEDLNRMSGLESRKRGWIKRVNEIAREMALEMKVVEVEPILGEDILTVYYMSEDRVDFRELVRVLAKEFSTRIEMRQVGARDEARLNADYERCGQHCCCRNFLKVLKPVSMKSAKVQKATLDPLKISGRCGRLMCCLRYEDETYEDLKRRLPRKRSRVGTPEGVGIVLDGQILTQLVLVELEHDGSRIAVPVEELMAPEEAPKPGERERAKREQDALRGLSPEQVADRTDERRRASAGGAGSKRTRGSRSKEQQQDAYREKAKAEARPRDIETTTGPNGEDAGDGGAPPTAATTPTHGDTSTGGGKRRGRRGQRRGKGKRVKGGPEAGASGDAAASHSTADSQTAGETESPTSSNAGERSSDSESPGDSTSPAGEPSGKPRNQQRRRRGGRGRRRGGRRGGGGGSGGNQPG